MESAKLEEYQRRVRELPWYFKMDLGNGIITPGWVDATNAEAHCRAYGIPADLSGKSVLDIGAADGFFSFEAERRGATRICAADADSYINTDFGPGGYRRDYTKLSLLGWSKKFATEKVRQDIEKNIERVVDFNEEIDSSKSFHLAKEILNSKVERVRLEAYEISAEKIGIFDVVFCFGVVYHLRHPLLLLDRIAQVTREMAIIQSLLIHQVFPDERHPEDVPLLRFIPGTEAFGDMTYWWLPNLLCLQELIVNAGFARCERVSDNTFKAFK